MTRALPPWLRIGDGFVSVEVVARPGSPRHGLLKIEGRGLVIGIASPAERGKANQELIESIAEIAGVARSAISILRGTSSPTKVLHISSVDPQGLAARLSGLSLDR